MNPLTTHHRSRIVLTVALVVLLAMGASALQPQGERSELFAEAPSQFFLKIRPWTLTFVKEGSKVTRLDISDSGEVMSGRRVD